MNERIQLPEQPIYEEKLASIGLTIPHFYEAIGAIDNCDLDRLRELNIDAERIINTQSDHSILRTTQDQFKDPRSGEYIPKRHAWHEQIVDSLLQGFEPEEHSGFYVYAGPPGVGKTTAINKDGVKGVITDPMIIQTRLIPGINKNVYAQVLQTKDEAFDVSELLAEKAFERRISMISESTLQNLPWISGALDEALARDYSPEITFIHKPIALCFQDAIEKRKRPISLNYLLKSLAGYRNLLRHDALKGVKVRVINKERNPGGRIIYDSSEGTLGENYDYQGILQEVSSLVSAIV